MKRLVTRIAVAATAAAAALVATPLAAEASNCYGQPGNTRLLTNPVTVDVRIVPNIGYGIAQVCVGVPGGVAYQEFALVAHPYGAMGPAACNPGNVGDQYTGVATGDITRVVGFTVSGGIGVATSPELCVNNARQYTISLPVRICSGFCTGAGVGDTGVVVGTFGLTGGPAGTTGSGVVVHNTGLMVNGSYVPIGPAAYANAGADTGAVSAPTRGPLVCGPLNLVCVPGSAGIYYDGGPVLGVGLTGVGTTYVTVPGGVRCAPLFTIAPVPPAC